MTARILILLHETDPYPAGPSYFVWGLRDVWREMGIDVRIARGLREIVPADLVLPHIDLTVTPPEYRSALDALPNVINRGLYDISKRRVSTNLLEADSAWNGPVIVKTDRNYGGLPERRVARRQRTLRGRVVAGLRRLSPTPASRCAVNGNEYLLVDHLSAVPEAVFADPSLVVERFLPEREGDTYFLRWLIFIGDRYRSMRVGSSNPLVKLADRESRELGVPVPDAVIAFRQAWGMDFGKIDFVVHDGVPVIFDVSRTPSDLPPPERLEACRPYGCGVLPLLASGADSSPPLNHRNVDA